MKFRSRCSGPDYLQPVPSPFAQRSRRTEIDKQAVAKGPKKGKKGYVDQEGRIWIRDHAHAGLPMHWDVQLDGGDDYFRVDTDGNILD